MRRILVIALLLPSISYAQPACEEQQKALTDVSEKYKSVYESYSKEGENLKEQATEFKIKVTWKDEEIIFDTPSVVIKNQKLVFGVPQVTMRTRQITFGTPSVRMKRVKTGQYPEFYCDTSTLVPKCTTRWSNTYADVPETFLEQQHIKLDIPEFTWADTQIIVGIPEFFMQRQKWVIGLPQFQLDSIYLNSDKLKARGQELKEKVAATRAAQGKQVSVALQGLYECYRMNLRTTKQDAQTRFDSALAQMDGIIQGLRSQGADPSKLAGADGSTTDLVQKRAELAQKREEAMVQFDRALRELDEGERSAIDKAR